MSIYKRFYGHFLAISIDEQVDQKVGDYTKSEETGLLLPKQEASKNRVYRLGTILQVSEDLKDMYGPGERIQIPWVGREKFYNLDGKEYYMIPKEDVIGVLPDGN